MLLRRLLDGERIAEPRRAASTRSATRSCEPRPVQAQLPILDRRLRAEEDPPDDRPPRRRLEHLGRARRGPGEARDPRRALRRGRARPERDRADDQLPDRRSATTVAAAEAAAAERFQVNGVENAGAGPHLAGPPDLVAAALAPFRDLGFSTVIVRLPAPYDRETIERMAEVGALLDG